jgi:hypothetical protein
MVGRACTICSNRRRVEIDAALLSGRKHAEIAREHEVSNDAISRHARKHLSATMANEADSIPVTGSGDIDLLGDMISLRGRLMRQLGKAERQRDPRTIVLIAREAVRISEIIGRLNGQIDASGLRISITAGPRGSIDIRTRILEKLAALSGPEIDGRVIEGGAG